VQFVGKSALHDVTQILNAIESGSTEAAEQLLPLVYYELRKLVAARLQHEKPGLTLQPTVLAHEASLRLVTGENSQRWNSRGHFFGAAAEAMRRILVETARRRQSLKRGGGMQRVELEPVQTVTQEPQDELLALDEALTRLEARWPDKAQVVKLRSFAGLTIAEAARTMKVSEATAERHWTFARAWLHSQLKN
jgi:RNA polymerase sigma factor (TIGR02999 family)